MDTSKWLNRGQPQTLQYAVMLLYINAAFAILFGGFLQLYGLIVIAGGIGGGYGVANERKWGYGVALGVAFAPFLFSILFYRSLLSPGESVINLAFELLLIGLLLHNQSREYERIWFK
jgi:hypothetical protein